MHNALQAFEWWRKWREKTRKESNLMTKLNAERERERASAQRRASQVAQKKRGEGVRG